MSTVTQPFAAPATWAEFERIKPLLIDTHGNAAVSALCGKCRVRHFTVEPHAADAACPRCGSTAAHCQRPSGHDAAGWHRERVEVFDALRDDLQAQGHPQIAPWATTPGHHA